MRPVQPAILVLLATLAPAFADPLVVKDARTNEVIAVVDPDVNTPVKIGDREVIVSRKEVSTTEQVARRIRIPNIDFDNTTVAEGIDFFRQRSRELDTDEPDPNRKGLNIRILDPETSEKGIHELKLRNVTLHHAMTAIAEQTGTTLVFGEESVLFRPAGPAKGPVVIKPSGATAAKARQIMIPVIDFDGTWLVEAVDFLRSRSRELDTAELDPVKKGINFRLQDKATSELVIHELKLRNISMHTAITVIAEHTGTIVEFGDESVLFKPAAK